jgi:hypothetical protein
MMKKPALTPARRKKMPRMTATEEVTALRAEHNRLTVIVEEAGARLIELDAARKPISERFSTAWTRRDNIERRLFLLERKVKQCAPVKGERAPKKEKDVSALLAQLTPAQMQMLRDMLTEKGGAE